MRSSLLLIDSTRQGGRFQRVLSWRLPFFYPQNTTVGKKKAPIKQLSLEQVSLLKDFPSPPVNVTALTFKISYHVLYQRQWAQEQMQTLVWELKKKRLKVPQILAEENTKDSCSDQLI